MQHSTRLKVDEALQILVLQSYGCSQQVIISNINQYKKVFLVKLSVNNVFECAFFMRNIV